MNRIFRVVIDRCTGRRVVASELAKRHGAGGGRVALIKGGLLAVLSGVSVGTLGQTVTINEISVTAGGYSNLANDYGNDIEVSQGITVDGSGSLLEGNGVTLSLPASPSYFTVLDGGHADLKNGELNMDQGLLSVSGTGSTVDLNGMTVATNDIGISGGGVLQGDGGTLTSGYLDVFDGGQVDLKDGTLDVGWVNITGAGSQVELDTMQANNGFEVSDGAVLTGTDVTFSGQPGASGWAGVRDGGKLDLTGGKLDLEQGGELYVWGTDSEARLNAVQVIADRITVRDGASLTGTDATFSTQSGSWGSAEVGDGSTLDLTGGTLDLGDGSLSVWGTATLNNMQVVAGDIQVNDGALTGNDVTFSASGNSSIGVGGAGSTITLDDTTVDADFINIGVSNGASLTGTDVIFSGASGGSIWVDDGGQIDLTGGELNLGQNPGLGQYDLSISGVGSRVDLNGTQITADSVRVADGAYLGLTGVELDARYYGVYAEGDGTRAEVGSSSIRVDEGIGAAVGGGAFLDVADSELRIRDGAVFEVGSTNSQATRIELDNVTATAEESGGYWSLAGWGTAGSTGVPGDMGLLLVSYASGSSTVEFSASNSTLSGAVISIAELGSVSEETIFTLKDGTTFTGIVMPDELVASMLPPRFLLDLDATSTWNLNGASSNLTELKHAGTVNFVSPPSSPAVTDFKTLTIGNYVGSGGTFVLNTQLGDDSSQSDRIHITGDSSGSAYIQVKNASGAGAETTHGILLVQVDGQSNATFTQKDRAVAGSYEYFLQKDSNDGNWYLLSGPRSGPKPSILRAEVGAYLSNQTAGARLFQHSMHERRGDVLYGDKGRASVWVRAEHGKLDMADISKQLSVDSRQDVFQLGADLFHWEQGRDRVVVGVMGGRGEATNKARSSLTGYRAKGEVEGYNLGVYGTWFRSAADQLDGLYVDGWLQYAWFDDEVKGNGLAKESYDSKSWSASLEAGYSILLGRGGNATWYLQPQAQLIYTDYSADNHIERSSGTRISGSDMSEVSSRLGARLYVRPDSEAIRVQPYMAVNWWSGGQKSTLRFDGVKQSQDPSDLYEVSLGAQAVVDGGWALWGEVGRQHGSRGFRNTEGKIGLRKSF